MAAPVIYSKICITLSFLNKAPTPSTVWVRVKDFASEFNCNHCVAVSGERLAKGLRNSLLYSDAVPEIFLALDREGLNVGHPFEHYARKGCQPFLVSDVRNDKQFRGLRWSELLPEPIRSGDAIVVPVRATHGYGGLLIFGGRDLRDSSVARSSLAVVAHSAFDRLAFLQRGAPARNGSILTARELECLELLARGMDDQNIADVLGISQRTVRFHVDHAKNKLGGTNRVHALAKAIGIGLISL